MAKDKLTDYDSTAANNLDVGGISVAEGMLPSGVNNAIREQMSHLADFAAGTSGVDVLKLQDDTDTNSIKLQAPSSVTTTTTFTLPDGDGASGQTMITDGAGTLSWAAPYGNRNLIINGAMQVAQRGTSETGVTSMQYADAPDHYQLVIGTMGTYTVSQSTDAPEGFANSYKIECTTADASPAATDYFFFWTKHEGQDVQHLKFGTSSAENLTLSFWVKSNLTGTWQVSFRDKDNSRMIAGTYTTNAANTWEYKTITVAGDTGSSGFDNDNGESFNLEFVLGAGTDFTSGSAPTAWQTTSTGDRAAANTVNIASSTSNYWAITGLQLEVGSQATPFEHRSYGDELSRCQRYYELIGYALGRAVSNSQAEVNSAFKVDKRAAPTITLKNGTSAIAEFLRAAANVTSLDSTYNSQTTHCGNRVTSSDTGMNNAEMVSIIRPDTFAVDAEL